ncbi:MAG: YraN family protein [Lachnospiraceae bacterium]|nr:YraN family protein [Lachnospiraceae bacterium]
MNRRTVGTANEERAAKYLREHGYSVIAQNYRCVFGEIDIVAEEKGEIVFAEVKYRRTTAFGLPEEAVDIHKQARIRKIAMVFLKENRMPQDMAMRFDVVAMDEREIRLYRNAF